MIRVALVAIVVVATACGPSSKQGPCDGDTPSPECSIACDPTPAAPNTCPAGFHCSESGTCTADCTPGGDECSGAATCDPNGFCVDTTGDGNSGPDADCPNVNFTATAITPTIQLLIDKSGSMLNDDFGGQVRYEAIRDALVGAGGVVGQYQAQAYFGATLYTQSSSTCPVLLPGAGGTGRALNNLPAIQNIITSNYPVNGQGTPTGPSLEATYLDLVANPPPPDSPPIIVLATDGQPYTCPDNSNNTLGQMQSLAAAQAAYAAGIRTYVLGVAVDGGTAAHLQQVANVGAGMDPVTGNAPYYSADNPASLAAAFQAIISGVVSCEVMLDGDINQDQAELGIVRLNGMILMYGTDWELVGTNVIRLLGAACQTFLGSSNPTVTAEFPCGAIIE